MAKAVKKVLIVLAVLVMSVGILCACDDNNDDGYPQEKGKFYTLSQAYEQGLISRNDLLNIYCQYIGHTVDDFEPAAKTPEVLDEQTVQDIKESWMYCEVDNVPKTREEIDEEVTIEKYLGTYNGYVAVYISGGWRGFFQKVTTIEIDGITFNYRDTNEIHVWKKN